MDLEALRKAIQAQRELLSLTKAAGAVAVPQPPKGERKAAAASTSPLMAQLAADHKRDGKLRAVPDSATPSPSNGVSPTDETEDQDVDEGVGGGVLSQTEPKNQSTAPWREWPSS